MTTLWIPLTIAAAFLQNLRTMLQKHLRARLSTNASSFARFAFGSPLVILYVIGLHALAGFPWPRPNAAFVGWVVLGGVAQIVATSCLIHLFGFRNLAVGVAYSKTEVIQAAIFGFVFLGDRVTLWGAAAVAIGTAGVMLISLTGGLSWRALLAGWSERPALVGLASGALFGVAAVAFRAAALALGEAGFVMPAAVTLLWANLLQTALMGGYLYWRERDELGKFVAAWRLSALTGAVGVAASAMWFMAMTIQLVAYVRTLSLIELVFTFLASRFFFRERPRRREVIGIALLLVGVAMMLNLR
ncbi:MAG TPA: EamA family transporter [Stellaceae bacterium]|nr:EamA family transporter [Stellaceae bacterium]